jgi:hypothetical protein
MKSLLLIFTLLFSTLMFSSPSFAKWKKVGESVDGNTFYVDFGRIRKQNGYVYFWKLMNLLKSLENEILSANFYYQGDCKLFRYKYLSYSFHKEPMGGGNGEVLEPKGENANWKYPSPNSMNEYVLKQVCSR